MRYTSPLHVTLLMLTSIGNVSFSDSGMIGSTISGLSSTVSPTEYELERGSIFVSVRVT
jgi:hypothetical protein